MRSDHLQLEKLAILNELDDLYDKLPELEEEFKTAAIESDEDDPIMNTRLDNAERILSRIRELEVLAGYPQDDAYLFTIWQFVWIVELCRFIMRALVKLVWLFLGRH